MANQQTQKDTPEAKLEHIAGAVHEAGPGNGAHAVKEAVDRTVAAGGHAADEAVRVTRDLGGAFANSYGVFADGIQELQHGYWRIVQNSFDIATSRPPGWMRFGNLTELSELQREKFSKYLDGVADANRTLFDVSARVAETAAKPLQGQAGHRTH